MRERERDKELYAFILQVGSGLLHGLVTNIVDQLRQVKILKTL